MQIQQPITNLFGDSISEIAMLVKMTTARWSGQIVDRQVTAKVNSSMAAAKDAGKYVKVLATKKDLSKVNHWYRKAIAFHEKNTLPWNGKAEGILPVANYYKYKEGFLEIRDSFFEAVEEVISRLPEIKTAAMIRLGKMFSEEEFPSDVDLRQKFNLEMVFYPIPDPSDFRLNISSKDMAKMREMYSQNLDGIIEDAMVELWRRLYNQVVRIADTLSTPERTFQRSMLDNAMEIIELLPRLNFRQDTDLESMRIKVEQQLLSYEAEELRSDTSIRLETANAAKEIASQMKKINPQLRAIEF